MLIDDDEIDVFVNETLIKKSFFAENVFKYSGSVCSLEFFKNLETIANLSDELLPSFLFLDINMPVLDGFQFLDEFNKFSELLRKKIKIVILSTSSDINDIKKASHYKQVVKFLQKPLTEKDLGDLN